MLTEACVRVLRAVCYLFFFAALLTGCGPSSTDVANSTKASLQQYLDSSSDLKSLHLTVREVTAIKVGKNRYEGMATISSKSAQHDISMKITADGQNTIWSAEPGAFAPFLLEPKPTTDSLPPSRNYSNSNNADPLNESPESWAIKAIQETYTFVINQPEELQHGSWTASELPRSEYPPVHGNWDFFVVHYSIPERGLDCQWQLGFPVSEWKAYSPKPLDGCALTLFKVR